MLNNTTCGFIRFPRVPIITYKVSVVTDDEATNGNNHFISKLKGETTVLQIMTISNRHLTLYARKVLSLTFNTYYY